jgi:hypothetical protein
MDLTVILMNQADTIASHSFKQDLYKYAYSIIVILECFVCFCSFMCSFKCHCIFTSIGHQKKFRTFSFNLRKSGWLFARHSLLYTVARISPLSHINCPLPRKYFHLLTSLATLEAATVHEGASCRLQYTRAGN